MDFLIIFLLIITGLVVFFLLFWRFWFLRDPRRKIPSGNNIISPADGKVNKIIRGTKWKQKINKGLMGKINTLAGEISKEYYLVNIVMTPFDVHIQRAPIAGKVKKVKYTKGRFKNAVSSEIAIENENNEILIEGRIKVKVIQIAGAVARRIICFVKKNQNLNKGERLGLINFGSQVSLIIPANVKLNIKKGQRVKAGETIIGEIKDIK
ncbi:MAG: phosphatidylserine decarboxylase [Nanoarchaeota archaeon]